ncbi:hypothetical protein MTX20_26385 [Bradyrhizobium sp. ISRA435]|nr:hypothetical protein MTX20_26385 [Bradyrhizobium sp. ISRA435]
MKAFLLYPDRDFDPTLLLSRRDKASHQRHKDPALDLRHALPWNHADITQDLGLDIVLRAMSADDEFVFEAAMVGLLGGTSDTQTIRYRQDVLRDVLKQRAVAREMYNITVEALKGERTHHWVSFGRYPTGTLHHAVEVLEVFVASLRKLRNLADQHVAKCHSEGFSRLFAMLQSELDDRYFALIDQHLKRLKFKGRNSDQYIARKGQQSDRVCSAQAAP